MISDCVGTGYKSGIVSLFSARMSTTTRDFRSGSRQDRVSFSIQQILGRHLASVPDTSPIYPAGGARRTFYQL